MLMEVMKPIKSLVPSGFDNEQIHSTALIWKLLESAENSGEYILIMVACPEVYFPALLTLRSYSKVNLPSGSWSIKKWLAASLVD